MRIQFTQKPCVSFKIPTLQPSMSDFSWNQKTKNSEKIEQNKNFEYFSTLQLRLYQKQHTIKLRRKRSSCDSLLHCEFSNGRQAIESKHFKRYGMIKPSIVSFVMMMMKIHCSTYARRGGRVGVEEALWNTANIERTLAMEYCGNVGKRNKTIDLFGKLGLLYFHFVAAYRFHAFSQDMFIEKTRCRKQPK